MKNAEHLGSSQLRKATSSSLTKAYMFDTFEKDTIHVVREAAYTKIATFSNQRKKKG